LFIIIIVAIFDQITKLLALHYLSQSSSIKVLGDFFMLTLTYNKGGAMGTSFVSPNFYLILSIIILIIILYYIYINSTNRILSIPLAIIAGGAIGNIVDRIVRGEVIDFLDFDFFNINIFGYQMDRWWTFNFADVFISCSIIYLLVIMFIIKHDETNNEPPKENNLFENKQSQ